HVACHHRTVVGQWDRPPPGSPPFPYTTLFRSPSEALERELARWVRRQIGPIALPDRIHWAPALPKTRSGKIMRRILRRIAAGSVEDLGDTSTLADPAAVESLLRGRQETAPAAS